MLLALAIVPLPPLTQRLSDFIWGAIAPAAAPVSSLNVIPMRTRPTANTHWQLQLRRFEPVIVLVHFHGVLKSGTVELTKFPQGKL